MPSDPTAPPADAPLVAPSSSHQSQLAYQRPPAVTSGPAYPHAPPSWPQAPPAAAYSGWVQHQPPPSSWHDPDAGLRKARTALGWAIGAAVGAVLALVLGVIAMFMSGFGMLALDGGFYESLRGQVDGVTNGASVPGAELELSMAEVLDEWYVDVEDLSCPDTKGVSTSTSVVCTARLDGFEWTGVVFFEDGQGSYVILEL
jgi:hypothetical protein